MRSGWLWILGVSAAVVCSAVGRLQGEVLSLSAFSGRTAPGWKFIRSGTGHGASLTAGRHDPVDNGWLRLTNGITNEANAVIYDKAVSLPSGGGLRVEFDLSIWGGTGGPNGGDGLTFFLIDGDTPSVKPGAYGGSLGYAQRDGVAGAAGGYLGIGLDEFGNFSNPTEGRVGGPGARPNAVVVRGEAKSGYAYLAGTESHAPGFFGNTVARTRSSAPADYRRVLMTLEQVADGHLEITVAMVSGKGNDAVKYIDKLNIGKRQSPLPESIKFGFAASTGSATAVHEIRDLSISTFSPIPEPVAPGLLTAVIGVVLIRRRRVPSRKAGVDVLPVGPRLDRPGV